VQWTKQNEQTVYENRWFSVNLADVELPDGRHLDHFLIRLRPVAVATVVNEANEVLLLWRHRFITDSWGGNSRRVSSRTARTSPSRRPANWRRRPGGDRDPCGI
jgi:hypothetical protein